MLLELILRWMHILPAIALIGGTFFLRLSLAPALETQSDETRASLLAAWRPRWARVVMITSGTLLLSGLVNAVHIIKAYDFGDAPYHIFVAVKLILALVIFWISAVLSGRSKTAEKFRDKLTFWLTVNVALAVLMVGLAGYMKVMPRVPAEADVAASTDVS